MRKLVVLIGISLVASPLAYAGDAGEVWGTYVSPPGGADILTTGSDADSTTTTNDSGLELIGGELTIIRGCNNSEILKWVEATDTWDCAADDGGAGSGDNVTIDSVAADTTANFRDSIYLDFTLTDGGAGGPDDVDGIFNYAETQAGNPALNAEEVIFTTDGTGGGGLLFEGTTADTNEGLLQWNPTTDKILTLPDATDTLVARDTTDTLTNKTIDATNTVTINASDITDLSANSDITADLEEETHCSEHDSADVDCSGETIVFAADSLDFTEIVQNNTLAGNPALAVDECYFIATATGGGFICEGSTEDTNEQIYQFPDANGADTTEFIVVSDDANVSAAEAGFLDGVTAAIADTDDTLAVFAATTSAQLRGVLSDESGTGAAIFAGGAIAAATATTPAADDNDTSVATTAYVQTEINGAGGTNLSCSSGQCNVDDVFVLTAGDTMTGELVADDLGIEFTAGDALTDCSTFAATGGGIFFDDSEGIFKKCQDNVLTDLDTTGGAGVWTDADPVLLNTTSRDVAVGAAQINTSKFSVDGDADQVQFSVQQHSTQTDDPIILENSAGTELFSVSPSPSIKLLEVADAPGDTAGYGQIWVNTATPNELYFTDDAGTDHQLGVGGGSKAPKLYSWAGVSTLPSKPLGGGADGIASVTKDNGGGSNFESFSVSYDDTDDECRGVIFKVPSDVDTSGTVTFYTSWYSQTVTSGNVMWDFRWHEVNEGESWDGAETVEAAAADAVQGTTDLVTETTWTETLSNLGWTADEMIVGAFCRNGDDASDTLTGDAEAQILAIEIPRS